MASYQTVTIGGKTVFKYTSPEGRTVFSDVPPTPDQVLQESGGESSDDTPICDNRCMGRIKTLQDKYHVTQAQAADMYQREQDEKAQQERRLKDVEEAREQGRLRALQEEEAELAKAEDALSATNIAKEILLPQSKLDWVLLLAGAISKVGEGTEAVYKVLSREKALKKIQERRKIIKEILEGKRAAKAKEGVMIKRKLSSMVKISPKQLDKKAKHSLDFGVNTTKKNPETLQEYGKAIESHLDDPNTIQHGTYIHSPGSTVYYNNATNNVVVVDSGGNFVSGWKLDPSTKQYSDYINNGKLF